VIRLCTQAFVMLANAHARDGDGGEDGARQRGDVPGWVLITVMTAGLVTGLWVVAEPQLKSFFQSALNAVHGP